MCFFTQPPIAEINDVCILSGPLPQERFSSTSHPSTLPRTHTHPFPPHLLASPPAGTKGIGRASAIELLGLGASVVVTARSAADVAACVGEWRATYGADRVHGFACDVSARDDRVALFAFVHKLWGGDLDILINNVRAAWFVGLARGRKVRVEWQGSGTGQSLGGGEGPTERHTDGVNVKPPKGKV